MLRMTPVALALSVCMLLSAGARPRPRRVKPHSPRSEVKADPDSPADAPPLCTRASGLKARLGSKRPGSHGYPFRITAYGQAIGNQHARSIADAWWRTIPPCASPPPGTCARTSASADSM